MNLYFDNTGNLATEINTNKYWNKYNKEQVLTKGCESQRIQHLHNTNT